MPVSILQQVDTVTTATGPVTSDVVTVATEQPIVAGRVRIYLGGDIDSSTELADIKIDGVIVWGSVFLAGVANAMGFYGEFDIPASLIGKTSFTVEHASQSTAVNVSYSPDPGQAALDGYTPGEKTAVSRVFLAFHLDLQDFPVEPTGVPAPAGEWYDDFGLDTHLAAPSNWVLPWNTVDQMMVFESPYYLQNKALFIRKVVSSRWVAQATPVPNVSTLEMIARVRVSELRGNALRFYTGISGAVGSETGFFIDLWHNPALGGEMSHRLQVRTGLYSNGGLTYTTGVPYGMMFDLHTWYKFRLRVHGDYYAFRLWREDEFEPTVWTLAGNRTGLPLSGGFGIGGFASEALYEVDAVRVAYGGWPSVPLELDPLPSVVGLPQAPSQVIAEQSGMDVVLNWTDMFGADGYRVFRDGVLIGTTTGATTFIDVGVGYGTYTYEVRTVWGTP